MIENLKLRLGILTLLFAIGDGFLKNIIFDVTDSIFGYYTFGIATVSSFLFLVLSHVYFKPKKGGKYSNKEIGLNKKISMGFITLSVICFLFYLNSFWANTQTYNNGEKTFTYFKTNEYLAVPLDSIQHQKAEGIKDVNEAALIYLYFGNDTGNFYQKSSLDRLRFRLLLQYTFFIIFASVGVNIIVDILVSNFANKKHKIEKQVEKKQI